MPFDFWTPDNLFFWVAMVLIVFFVGLFRYLTRASRHRMLETLAEKGQQVTPDLVDRIDRARHAGDQ